METVKISKEIFQSIIEHAKAEAPLECCGLLMGQNEAITHVRKMQNTLQSPIRYSMAPQELFYFFKDLRSRELKHLGIYHSHPASEAYPSLVDVEQAYYPDCTYFIVSLRNSLLPSVRAFAILNNGVIEKGIQFMG